jgi:hypothetical protein
LCAYLSDYEFQRWCDKCNNALHKVQFIANNFKAVPEYSVTINTHQYKIDVAILNKNETNAMIGAVEVFYTHPIDSIKRSDLNMLTDNNCFEIDAILILDHIPGKQVILKDLNHCEQCYSCKLEHKQESKLELKQKILNCTRISIPLNVPYNLTEVAYRAGAIWDGGKNSYTARDTKTLKKCIQFLPYEDQEDCKNILDTMKLEFIQLNNAKRGFAIQ